MRNTVYAAVMAPFLAIVIAFASGVAMAAATEESDRPAGGASGSGMTDQMKARMQDEMSGRMQGEMGGHMRGRMPEQIKSGKADEGKAAESIEGKREFSGEARSGVSGQMSPRMSGERDVGRTGRESMAVTDRQEAGTTVQPTPGHTREPVRQAPAVPQTSSQAVVGQAVVAGVDMPDNCLRIRRGPSMSYDIIECAARGATLNLTGVFSNDGRWAQVDNNGWVFVRQIKTDVKPPQSVAKRSSPSEAEDAWEQAAGAGSYATGEGAYGPYYGDSSYYSYGWPGYYYSPGGSFPGPLRFGLPPPPPLPALPSPGSLLP